ncbi:uncharacterized protein LOC115700486 [Cannabis sativa]|uniref:uncharacterized protein LOC115700486 n=1 Tax=Cannabis sativa TaxID=3483 RepID=UPI0029C9D203|nr:uncharacterized protein LOC115700486 [Cannabis sativa]
MKINCVFFLFLQDYTMENRAHQEEIHEININVETLVSNKFEKDVSANLVMPSLCSIFKVPNILSRHNTAAFTPNAFSFGPFHHNNNQLKSTKKIKQKYLLDLATRLPEPNPILFKKLTRVVHEIQSEARQYYAGPIDMKEDEFLEMLVLDGCFIIELFRKKSYPNLRGEGDPIFSMPCLLQFLYHDLILLENTLELAPVMRISSTYTKTSKGLPFEVLKNKLLSETELVNPQANNALLSFSYQALERSISCSSRGWEMLFGLWNLVSKLGCYLVEAIFKGTLKKRDLRLIVLDKTQIRSEFNSDIVVTRALMMKVVVILGDMMRGSTIKKPGVICVRSCCSNMCLRVVGGRGCIIVIRTIVGDIKSSVTFLNCVTNSSTELACRAIIVLEDRLPDFSFSTVPNSCSRVVQISEEVAQFTTCPIIDSDMERLNDELLHRRRSPWKYTFSSGTKLSYKKDENRERSKKRKGILYSMLCTVMIQELLPNHMDSVSQQKTLFDLTQTSTNSSTDENKPQPLVKLVIEFFGNIFSSIPIPIEPLVSNNNNTLKHILDLLRESLVLNSDKTKHKSLEWGPMPPATDLWNSGIKFKVNSTSKSLLDIKFCSKTGVMVIPELLIQETSETVFRNLISLEQCCPNCEPIFTSYAFLLDNLINGNGDIEVLCKSKAIVSWLNIEDATKLFNRLYIDTFVKENYYDSLINEVNKYRHLRWPRYRRVLTRDYFKHPWALISVIAASIALILTFLQTLYAILGKDN